MSDDLARQEALARIESNIRSAGRHIYAIQMGTEPRFWYTVGLSEGALGAELVIAGAALFDMMDVSDALNDLGEAARVGSLDPAAACVAAHLGEVRFQQADSSWIDRLLLGAVGYYAPKPVRAYQVLLRPELTTIDIPDLSRPWDPAVEPIWQWLELPWPYDVHQDTLVVTNFRALSGHPITEVCHWEDDEWELVAGTDAPVAKTDVTVVPFATLLAADPSIEEVLQLPCGECLRRENLSADWKPWGH